MPTNISPTDAQRAGLGTAIKMIQDPFNYKRLLLFGAQGALICDDHTADSPKWRAVRLSSTADLTWSQTFDLTSSDGGWFVDTAHPYCHYTAGTGFVGDCIDQGGGNINAVVIRLDIPGGAVVTSFDVTYTATFAAPLPTGGPQLEGNFFYSGGQDDYSNATADGTHTVTYTETNTRTITELRTVCKVYEGPDASCGSITNPIVSRIVVRGTGNNPFGGSASGSITYFGDIQGSINRPGFFCWLGQDGSNVYVYRTLNYFKTRSRVLLDAYVAGHAYSLSVGSFGNRTTRGVVTVVAGSTIYKSTNYAGSFSDLSIIENSEGGQIAVPFSRAGGSVNAGTSPQYYAVTGASGGNIKVRNLAGSSVTLNAGTTHYPLTAQSFYAYAQDGGIAYCLLDDGTVKATSDGGANWSTAGTAPIHGSQALCITGSPKNSQFLLVSGTSALAFSVDSGASWTDLWTSYDTWTTANLGSALGKTIQTAIIDLNLLYSSSVTS